MAFRALLFSKSSETNAAITAACKNAGIRAEVCSDIFTAIEKVKKQAFSCVIADWADQPESSFLLKRARESAVNRETVAVAVVDREPTQAELRDTCLDFLIERSFAVEAAETVLSKAREKMQPSDDEETTERPEEDNHAAAPSLGADQTQCSQQTQPDLSPETGPSEDYGATAPYPEEEPPSRSHAIGFRGPAAALLLLTAVFFLWRSHEIFEYLAQTPEGGFRVLHESVAALFHANPTAASPDVSASDPQPDAYFSRDAHTSNAQTPALRVVATESTLAEMQIPLRKAPEFPLPVPTLERREVVPVRKAPAPIPESMKNSAPIAPPVVVTVSPAQMMPVSIPQPQPAVQQVSEPVTVSEATELALLIHTVDPVYPPEALAQKLHGPVVLQARVGRDGSVEDLKIVRGYFILGRAAITAVKQWRFQPYTVNGHPAATQTVITINFTNPSN
jgi:TonB family protein